jgi:hypothetical protein
MTSLLDKSTPVPVVESFHPRILYATQAIAWENADYAENDSSPAGTGGREVSIKSRQIRFNSTLCTRDKPISNQFLIERCCQSQPTTHKCTQASFKHTIIKTALGTKCQELPDKIPPQTYAQRHTQSQGTQRGGLSSEGRNRRISTINYNISSPPKQFQEKAKPAFHTPQFNEFKPMAVLPAERLHRRVNWPPGSWRPPDRGGSSTTHPISRMGINPTPSPEGSETHPITFKNLNL